MHQLEHEAALETAVAAAGAGGVISRHGFLEPRTVKAKGLHDIVTEIDEAAEEAICDILLARFPDDGVLAEERGRTEGSSPYIWVVDPLDGTYNYAAQLPFWCVSVARYNMQTRQVELAVILDPLHEELFVAERGKGATLNGKPIHVAEVTELSRSMVACDIGYVQEISRRMLNAAVQVQPQVRRLRILGSAVLAMAYVANGRIDAFFHLHLQPWDLAAAWLLIEEAGGRCTNWLGGQTHLEDHEVVAAPPAVCEALARKIAPFHGDRRE